MRRGIGRGIRRGGASCGFSLIEMVVALALLSLTLAMMPGAIDMARRAAGTAPRLERAAAISAALDVMGRWLPTAMPSLTVDDVRQRVPAFDGQADRVSFAAPAPASVKTGGVMLYQLRLLQAAGARAGRFDLAAELAPLTTDGPDQSARPAAEKHVLVEDVARLSVRYFGLPANGDGGPAWQDSWSGRMELPQLVEISFDLSGPDAGRRTHKLMAELRLRPALR
jgi:prepilin-type N-terminal cleavage/methylation domain-containing protein